MSALVRRTLILTLALATGGFAADLSKRDADQARQAWMSGYLKIESAAKAVEEKKLMFALELYEEALATFQEVDVRYPGWNPDVVKFRINFCTEKVRELREAVEVAAEKMSRPDLIRTVKRLRKQRDSFDSVKEKLQADLKAVEERLADLQKQNGELAAGQADLAQLRQTKQTLTAEKGALESQIADLNKALAAAATANQEALAAAKATAAKDLAKAEAEAAEARGLKKSLAQKTKEADNAASQVADLKKGTAKLEGELVAERGQITKLQAEAKALRDAKGTAEASSAAVQAIAKLSDERAVALAKAEADVAGRDAKIKKLEVLIEQTDAVEIDALAKQARTATTALKKAEIRLAEAQKSLLSRVAAEKRLIDERNKQIEAERVVARKVREREVKLHKYLTDAAAAKQAKKSADALWNLGKVLEMEPNHKQATAHIGLIQADLGKDEEAERMLTKAYNLDPTNKEVVLRLGYVQLNQEKMFEALATLMQGAKLDPKRADFRRFSGIACRALAWPAASEAQLRKANELDPKDGEAAFNLAILLATLDEPRTDEAQEWYNKALKLGAKPDAGLEKYFKEH